MGKPNPLALNPAIKSELAMKKEVNEAINNPNFSFFNFKPILNINIDVINININGTNATTALGGILENS